MPNNTMSPIELAIANQKAQDLAPIIRSIYAQESSSGKANTTAANYAGARGPMQVILPTFKDMQSRGYIPQDYRWDNPQHSLEAGVAYIRHLADKFKTKDPMVIGAGYYGGPGAINDDGTIDMNRRDPRNPNAPTVGEYAQQVKNRVLELSPTFFKRKKEAAPVLSARAGSTPASPDADENKSLEDLMYEMFVLNPSKKKKKSSKAGGAIENTTHDRKLI